MGNGVGYGVEPLLVHYNIAVCGEVFRKFFGNCGAELANALFVDNDVEILIRLTFGDLLRNGSRQSFAVGRGYRGGNLFGELFGVDFGNIIGERGRRFFGNRVFVYLSHVELFGYGTRNLFAVNFGVEGISGELFSH